MSNAGPCVVVAACRSLSRDDDLQISPTTSTATTRGAMSPTTSRESGRRLSDLTNYRRDLAVLDPPRGHSNPSNYPASLLDESADNMSIFSQFSPGLHGLGSRTGASSSLGLQDSPEPLYYPDGRRPSAASVTTTASSTGSKASGPRGGMRKLQGFFGEEFPGRDSSESSLPTSYMGKDQRSRSYSHTRPTHRDRNYSNATDHTRDASPASSRPRTPVPAPEVVPFLYQDNTVSLTCVSESLFSSLSPSPAFSPSPCFVFFFFSPYLSFFSLSLSFSLILQSPCLCLPFPETA
jgi:adenylate cyclase